MDTIKTDTKYNFEKAENESFLWTYFDGTSGSMLRHKASNMSIYQMRWIDDNGMMADNVVGDIREAAIAFWAELGKLQIQKPPVLEEDYADPEPIHGVNGYCRKCGSYCYGDCEAN